jgi:hypothetical protein
MVARFKALIKPGFAVPALRATAGELRAEFRSVVA